MESTQDNETRRVLACDEAFFNALILADHHTLSTVLTDDFLIVDVMGGQVASREDLLAAITSGELRFVDVMRFDDDLSVRLRDSVAVVVGRTRMTMNFQGSEVTARSRYTHVYVREGQPWRLLSAQGTPTSE